MPHLPLLLSFCLVDSAYGIVANPQNPKSTHIHRYERRGAHINLEPRPAIHGISQIRCSEGDGMRGEDKLRTISDASTCVVLTSVSQHNTEALRILTKYGQALLQP
ncbi:hypothetical protein VOLCADRAFT_89907 [Volvox carteri f. nagariensis]|uniref:Secreted protein n=1 Tax=Volvox carteri f. nagariensis TaxID=3068 RepID=D8TSZ3_VOLCA|nr:uncharacterized protein VOLCADRAFT_89907 [Volvox carteri f. nagariensis]EFJ49563.1 hypothetical protein VOLCADRAFT_89907 [Volvox carteri f. nagariensis]|eukprot:XP_002949544.1 hypothetical protein VOLCADRAFT_89907 [Volvox carteri f. nagariensis]